MLLVYLFNIISYLSTQAPHPQHIVDTKFNEEPNHQNPETEEAPYAEDYLYPPPEAPEIHTVEHQYTQVYTNRYYTPDYKEDL
ncbi:hypothetical protein GPJ56_009849 [Histomonas meleagridis]|uniref:uncharacterized protein n=1 Tax=Histomonas meleagridis TaxID=135588 RepID=UPI003559FB07|nr:hypothetical protein GPJ56_009849 [Histomonas meleagridis]KAH0802844.1 hypothetical protein GO595_004351 [Histomonas meleagridis]